MRSGVFALHGGGFLVGSSARAAAVEQPDRYLEDPISALGAGPVQLGDRAIEAHDIFAAILTAVHAEANRIVGHALSAVVLTVPPAWGRIRRDSLRQGATAAGFTDIVFVSSPAAVTTYLTSTTGQQVPSGGYVLVCDSGAAATTLTVLEQSDGGFQQLATVVATGAAGRDVDRLLALHLLDAVTPPGAPQLEEDANDPQWQSVLAAAEDAKVDLAEHDRTAVALHDPHPPVVVDRVALAKIAGPALAALDAATSEVLSAADIDRSHLFLVVLTGGGAALPGMKQAVAAATGHEPRLPGRTDIAAANGALTTATASTPLTTPLQLPRVKLRLTDFMRPALFAASSLALLAFVLMTLFTTNNASGLFVHLAEELISAAAVAAVLTTWSVAHLLPTLYLSTSNANPSEGAALIRATFSGAGVLGIVVSALFGLAIGALVGATTTEYASHAIVPALPVAAGALLIAALARSVPAPTIPTWLAHLRHPLAAVLLGSLGMIGMRYAVHAQISAGTSSVIIRLSAAITGIAIAMTVVRSRRLQVLTAVILAVGCFSVASLGNVRAITLAYVTGCVWWTATRVGVSARVAYPGLRERVHHLLATRSP
ncbi:Hsp70 family protein [Asanoa iriomotensis]